MKEKAIKMIATLRCPGFWESLQRFVSFKYMITYLAFFRIVNHLAPLALAANVTQTTNCQLDKVVLMFGSLMKQYQGMADPADDCKTGPHKQYREVVACFGSACVYCSSSS